MSSPSPRRPEVDHRTIKLMIGVIALGLAPIASLVADGAALGSISAAYHLGGWPQSTFVGFLFAITALLLAYNGRSVREMRVSKAASIAALVVALFPCACDNPVSTSGKIHWIAAGLMFVLLAVFCWEFHGRARRKPGPQAARRRWVYATCGCVILAVIGILGLDHLLGSPLGSRYHRFIFVGEATGLLAFGVSWITASRILPWITAPNERYSILAVSNPD